LFTAGGRLSAAVLRLARSSALIGSFGTLIAL
jgi:hypothetical protein